MIFQKFNPIFQKILKFVTRHKFIAAIIVIALIFGGYFGYKAIFVKKATTRYVTAAVEKGTLIVSVSGSGQVSASDQVDIKSKVSGDVVYIGVKKGQEVKAGTLLVQIDSSSAQKAVRDAQTALETAKLELEELVKPVDELDLLKAENNLAKAKESEQKAEDNIPEAYEDAFNDIANAFLELPTIMTSLNTALYSYDIAKSEVIVPDTYWNISALENSVNDENRSEMKKAISEAESNYETAKAKYDENLKNYKNTSRYSEQNVIEALLDETINCVRAMSEAVKSQTNMFDFWVDYRSKRSLSVFDIVTTYQSNLKSYTSKVTSYLSSLVSAQTALQDSKDTLLNAQRSVEELELSLADLKAGADELSIRAKKIAIQQKEDALTDAQQTLANHYIKAPFDGIVASINVKKGDSVSSSTVATIITKQKIAEISLNEVDIAQVKAGQKANITFDAVEDLNITGEVAEVDTIGTTTQGVITYGVKITFDTQDERVKPGMSVSTTVITNAKQDVLLVSSSAVKQQGDISYAQIMNESGTPQAQVVAVGLSNDTMTEITSGLKEGDKVITQTTTATTSTKATQNSRGGFMMMEGGGPR